MKLKLANIATIQSAYHFREKIENDKDGNIQFIQFKDIDELNRINYDNLSKISLPNIRQSQLLEKGNILMKCRGINFSASIIDKNVQNTIATSHFFILKIKNQNIIPEYLAWFLNEATTQKIIKLGVGGSYMQVLNKKFLENLEITIPSINIQKKIINLHSLGEQEQKLLIRKGELRSLLLNLQLRKILNKE